MHGEEDFRVENTEKTERSHNDICVLLLDSDATGLMNMSEILRKRGYRVVATTRADDLPRIINNQDEKIDLVLAEYSLVEMNKYGLFEKLKKVCEIPIVVAGEYVKEASMFYCLYRGARFYLNKPFMDSYLEKLWQYKVWTLQDLLSQIESDPTVKKNLITHSQSLGDELKRDNQNNKVKTEELDEYKGDYFQSGDQKKPELLGLEMQNESRQTDDENSKGNKRKERADTDTGEHTEKNYGSDLGDQKKPKLIFADDLQIETVEAIPNIEANNEREEPTETKQNGEGSEKEKPGLVCMEELENWSTQLLTDFADYEFSEFVEQDVLPMESIGGHCEIPLCPRESSNKEGSEKEKSEMVCMEELEKLSTQPVTDFTDYVGYEFLEQNFLPLESIGESVGHRKIPLSPQESSNKEAVGQPQMQNPHRGFDEELIEDGISLSDLDYDLQEGQGSTSDLELLEEIYNDLANVLKP